MICIIPAHGYSRRLPRKHTRLFCGHPLVIWSVVQAKCSHLIDEVYVSTNDEEVAEVCTEVGASIIWRDYDERPDDSAGVPIYHAIKRLQSMGIVGDACASGFATSPLRMPDAFDNVIRRYQAGDCYAAVTLGMQRELSVYCRITGKHGQCCYNLFGEKTDLRTNSEQVTHCYGTQWYVDIHDMYVRKLGNADDAAMEALKPSAEDVRLYGCVNVPAWQCLEVDTEEEFELAEWVMERRILKGRGKDVYYEYADAQ